MGFVSSFNEVRIATTFALFSAFAVATVSADTTYTTLAGPVNLVAGLSNLTVNTAINTTNQAVGIQAITDNSWSTAVFNLGGEFSVGLAPNNGILAGTFGSGTYFSGANQIILIGGYNGVSPAWGGWTVRLLLSDNSYSSSVAYTNSDLLLNPTVTANASLSSFNNANASTFSPGAFNTLYQILDLSAFDTANIGVKGIEMSNMTSSFPDISYIGVVSNVPEPSALSLLVIGMAGLAALRRRKA